MVAAQSQKASAVRAFPNPTQTSKLRDDELQRDKNQYLPKIEVCSLHLRLLTAFSQLRDRISRKDGLFGIEGSGEGHASEQRWTIFVAKAVARFERWLQLVIQPALATDSLYLSCSDGVLTTAFNDTSHHLRWSEVTPPPLDILMVLHSYMLNPRDFLQDSLRYNRISLWKIGFPWDFISTYLNSTDFTYDVPQSAVAVYEQVMSDSWDCDMASDTIMKCTRCDGSTRIPWIDLYSGNISQMEKGNTEMPFTLSCSNCQNSITQSSLCIHRFQADFQLLLDHNVPMPGTLLDLDGQVSQPTKKPGHPLHLNNELRSVLVDESIQQFRSGSGIENLSELSAFIQLRWESISETSNVNNELGQNSESKPTLPSFRRNLRRLIAAYDRNASSFALDLVGAVMRQGTFIEKMREFDWIHSPELNGHVSFAIDRYIGFFEVMKQNPERIAVPTFDVDLVWHTHQLTPKSYYDFTIRHCNDVFIDHDDKIVDNVLSNSFEWTCDEYAKVTGLPYDKCLCWCCALIEADHLATLEKRRAHNGKIKSRLKDIFARFSRDEMSEAEMSVMQIQQAKFERDYAKAQEHSELKSKRDFFDNYVWHYPMYAPSPDDISS